jgi:hypothetical protein
MLVLSMFALLDVLCCDAYAAKHVIDRKDQNPLRTLVPKSVGQPYGFSAHCMFLCVRARANLLQEMCGLERQGKAHPPACLSIAVSMS